MGWSRTQKIATAGAGAFLGWKLWQDVELRRRNRCLGPGQKILILGAGFAGVTAAQELSKLLP
jgi:NADPH-dependent 2,4-dienoyl-CoA reductase/sulfur reductase-like enzyme